MPKSFLIDTTRCTACRGCQIACKEWHDLPANETIQRGSHQNPPDLNPYNYKIVRFKERLNEQGNVVWNFFPDQCRHCTVPICKAVADNVAPGMFIKEEKTGAVLISKKAAALTTLSKADAQMVIDACPYNILRLNPQTQGLTKCDMCIDRVGNGMHPICVKTCPTDAMVFGEREEILTLAGQRLKSVKPRYPKAFLADYKDVNVIYLLAEEKEYYYKYATFI